MTPTPAVLLAAIELLAGLLKLVFHAPRPETSAEHNAWKPIAVALLLAVQLVCSTVVAIVTKAQYANCGNHVKIAVISLLVLNLCTWVSEAATSLTILSLPPAGIAHNHLANLAVYVVLVLCTVLSPIPVAHVRGVRVFDHPLDCSKLDRTDALAVIGLILIAVPATRSPSIAHILLNHGCGRAIYQDIWFLAFFQVWFWAFFATDVTSSLLLYKGLLVMLLPSISHLITYFRLCSTYTHFSS